MSGHSKFANIKHKKAKNDAQKGRIFTKMGREIAVAVKEGGADPTLNNKLNDIIRKAKSNNMPNDTIQRSIKKAAGDADGVSYEYITYEGYGPNGIAVIVDTLTDNKNRTAANVRAAFSKGNGNMGTSGCVGFMFDKKGQIVIEREATDMDEDELMMLAIEAGADDFEAEEEGYTVLTTPEAFGDVCKAIEEAGIEMASSEVTMIPQTSASLDDTNIKAWEKMMDLLENDDDVQEIYHNCDNVED
ncbi:MAG: YebC/PmpR family DNA-binding transcriptional regulator [Cellulosilyticaceae bacterium]